MFSYAQLSIRNRGRRICDFYWSFWPILCEFTFNFDRYILIYRPMCTHMGIGGSIVQSNLIDSTICLVCMKSLLWTRNQLHSQSDLNVTFRIGRTIMLTRAETRVVWQGYEVLSAVCLQLSVHETKLSLFQYTSSYSTKKLWTLPRYSYNTTSNRITVGSKFALLLVAWSMISRVDTPNYAWNWTGLWWMIHSTMSM